MNDLVRDLENLSREAVNQRASLALTAGKMATFEWNIATNTLVSDRASRNLFGLSNVSPSVKTAIDAIHPGDRERVRREIRKTLENDEDYDTSFRVVHPNGDIVWLGGRGRVMVRDAKGNPLRMLGINWDMTHVKAQEERLTHMVHEMNHRVNNGFALMEAMLLLGQEYADNIADFSDIMRNQIHALADAHQLAAGCFLHRSVHVETVHLGGVFTKVLRAWLNGPFADRIDLKVDPDLWLMSKDITPMSMVLCELAFRASKHSVLGPKAGRLVIRVTKDADGCARLDWQEIAEGDDAGLPANGDSVPDLGLGALLLESCLSKMSATLHQHDRHATGTRYQIGFPAGPEREKLC